VPEEKGTVEAGHKLSRTVSGFLVGVLHQCPNSFSINRPLLSDHFEEDGDQAFFNEYTSHGIYIYIYT
jgi:hypothetical protein